MVFKKRDRGSAYDPPNMMGMPAREKQWRGKQERGLAGAAQKRRMKYEARAREAYQEGAYKFGDKMSWRADSQQKKYSKHSKRASHYKGLASG